LLPPIADYVPAHVSLVETLRVALFEKRRRLMDDWACSCSRPTAGKGEVVTLRSGA